MDSRDEATLPVSRPQKSRKSISHLPSVLSVDKENMTTDLGGLSGPKRATGERSSKKTRSKSIGPGGLDALKDGTGNRRKSIAIPPPRSILKPSIPPLREIPAHVATRKQSPKKTQQPSTATSVEPPSFVLDQRSPEHSSRPSITGIGDLLNPFTAETQSAATETRVLLRTEEEQHAAAREREEREGLQVQKDLSSRREARRKSLANRRVSFAPEATLHTWDVVEYLQDSTTSSANTNSTRRASSFSTENIGPVSSDPAEPPSTPPEQIEDTIGESPERQRDLHQKKRRRSSGIPPLNFNNPDEEVFSSSPSSGSSAGGDDESDSQAFATGDDIISDSDSELDDEGTAMSIDAGDVTDMSLASVKSAASSTGSSARLEEALQLAAQQAGTQGIEFDEYGEGIPGEEEIVASFQPWSRSGEPVDTAACDDQENVNPFSPAFKNVLAKRPNIEDEEDNVSITMEMTQPMGEITPPQQSNDEVTMDMTVAIGGIISHPDLAAISRTKSTLNTRSQSTRRRSSGEGSSLGDETMDLTMAIGGIQQGSKMDDTTREADENEDMTMEFTSVLGGVLPPNNTSRTKVQRRTSMAHVGTSNRSQSADSAADDETMDMTVAVGGIMPALSTVAEEDTAAGMDFTTAIAGPIPKQPSPDYPSQSKITYGQSSAFHYALDASSVRNAQGATIASETGSPSLAAFKGKGLRRSVGPRVSTTPRSTSKTANVGPSHELPTPKNQTTPNSFRSVTPAKTTPSKALAHTPSKAASKDGESRAPTPKATPKASVSKKSATPNRLFQNSTAGTLTPSIVLTPQKRQSSGIGIDRAGLGSPRVAAILDRRGSIGDSAHAFTAGETTNTLQGVRFEDPRAMQEELEKQAQDDRDREDGRKIVERETDGAETEKDATVNLKEMIESLTPKKRPLKGRKSLHIGTAKGLLGKRPVELDDDDEDEVQDGIKRLKNHQGSPVKNIKLNGPPSKAETTGRVTRASRRSLETSSGNTITPTVGSSPMKGSNVTTPKGQARFRDPELFIGQPAVLSTDIEPVENPANDDVDHGEEHMHLQDFLNMTSIRFMELTTTKRRHTVAPNALQDGTKDSKHENGVNGSFENCVVAGACTIPMLELFQHSCRELKKYISEGRKVVREIETDTFEENPPLFREYISATADFRALMDNQFKNVKTHARLLSKATWYEWRMKLLDGLKDGLYRTQEGLKADAEILQHQQDLLESILPALFLEYSSVSNEESELKAAAEELANCDQKELSKARQRLVSVEADVQSKKRMIRELQEQLQGKDAAIAASTERKQACLDDIQEAERIRELCRGWSADEGLVYKAKVDDLERQYGWVITGVSGNQVSMTFRREVELVFDAASFKPNKADATPLQSVSSRIDLWYIAANREFQPLPLSPEKDFFLQNIREHCRGLPQAQTTVKALLTAVSEPWIKALEVANDIRTLNHDCPTEITKTSDSYIVVCAAILLVPLATKIDVEFHVQVRSAHDGFGVVVNPKCTVCYGEQFNEAKMTEFLINRTAAGGEGKKSWGDAVAELEMKLLARGRK